MMRSPDRMGVTSMVPRPWTAEIENEYTGMVGARSAPMGTPCLLTFQRATNIAASGPEPIVWLRSYRNYTVIGVLCALQGRRVPD